MVAGGDDDVWSWWQFREIKLIKRERHARRNSQRGGGGGLRRRAAGRRHVRTPTAAVGAACEFLRERERLKGGRGWNF